MIYSCLLYEQYQKGIEQMNDHVITPWRPREEARLLVSLAGDILDEYHAQGYQMTLRQLYYQMVARNFIENKHSEYMKLCSIMTRARWAGMLPMDCLYDPGREPVVPNTWSSPQAILRASARQYVSDRWRNGSTRVELWAEKDAVASVLRPVARKWQVTYQSARGFMGLGALSLVTKRIADYGVENVIVLYCGDHDASGQEIPRVIQDQLSRLGTWAYISVDVIALTSAQVDEYNPPPQPAKRTDSRVEKYFLEHGHDDVWELDALEPSVLSNVAETAILDYLPDDWHDLAAEDEAEREKMLRIVSENY